MRRRSIYFTIQRSKLIPMMMLFDWPEHLVSIGQRPVTTSAPQALMFMNNAAAREYAKGFGTILRKRVRDKQKPKDDQSKDKQRDYQPAIKFAYESAYGRPATDEELALSEDFIAEQVAIYVAEESKAAELAALTDFAQMILSGNEFVFVR